MFLRLYAGRVSSKRREVLVVGGGVIGLTSAFLLARAGVHVTLFDPAPGSGATWAAAGMVAPFAEIAPGEEENFKLQSGALQAWRDVAAALREVTNESLEIVDKGTLLVGFDAADRRLVAQFCAVATGFGVEAVPVARSTEASLFEGVTARVSDGLFLEGDAWLDPDQVVALLSTANERLGVTFVRDEVTSASTSQDGVTVTTASGETRADAGVLATGALALPSGVAERTSHVVRPVRGMTVRIRGVDRSALPTLRAFVRGRAFYMVSRPGGYCVLGASAEEQKELNVEVGELQRLLRDALDLVPSLESATMIETRQGLRPASADLAPFLEVVDGRWAWLTGHFRHGVTLAPLAAREALRFVQGLA